MEELIRGLAEDQNKPHQHFSEISVGTHRGFVPVEADNNNFTRPDLDIPATYDTAAMYTVDRAITRHASEVGPWVALDARSFVELDTWESRVCRLGPTDPYFLGAPFRPNADLADGGS